MKKDREAVLISEEQAVVNPAGVPAGDPPETTTNDSGRGRVTSRGPESSPAGASERYLAAAYRHEHGNPHRAPEEAKAYEARAALIRRTWTEGRDMTRDERRLMGKYDRILQTYADADLAAYRGSQGGER